MPLKPDPTFYPSPASAAEGPAEKLAYVVTLNTGTNGDRRPDALAVIDVDTESSTYGTAIGRLDMPNVGDELHHFGWTRARARCARGRRIRTSSAATCSSPGCAPAGSTSSTSRTTRSTRS